METFPAHILRFHCTQYTGVHPGCYKLESISQQQFREIHKVTGPRPATLLKKRLWHRRFPVNFVKFLRTHFLQNTSCGCFCIIQSICSAKLTNFLNFTSKHIRIFQRHFFKCRCDKSCKSLDKLQTDNFLLSSFFDKLCEKRLSNFPGTIWVTRKAEQGTWFSSNLLNPTFTWLFKAPPPTSVLPSK